MKTCHHDNDVGDNAIDELVRKPAKHDAPGVPSDDSVGKWVRSGGLLGFGEGGKKFFSEPLALALIPLESRTRVRSSFGSVDQSLHEERR